MIVDAKTERTHDYDSLNANRFIFIQPYLHSFPLRYCLKCGEGMRKISYIRKRDTPCKLDINIDTDNPHFFHKFINQINCLCHHLPYISQSIGDENTTSTEKSKME